MKKFFYATMVALAGLAFAACNPTDANEQGGGSSTKAPVLGTIEGTVLDIAGNDIVITFTEADFGQKVSVDYALYVDKVGNKMADKSLVKTEISGNSITITQANLSLAIQKLGFEVGEEAEVEFALYATVGNKELVSDYVKATFTVCAAEVDYDAFPKVWVIGNLNGWSFDNVEANKDYLYDVNGDGNYTGLVYYAAKANTGWKLAIPGGSAGAYQWDDAHNWGFGDEVPEEEALEATLVCAGSSSDMKVWAHNFYEWTFNPEALTLTMTAPENWDGTKTPVGFDYMYLVGNFNDWKTFDPNFKMKYIPTKHTFYVDVTLAANAEIKFIADGQLSNDWYIAWGAEGAWEGGNIIVPDAGNYRVYFNFNEKSYTLDTAAYGTEEAGGIEVAERDFNRPDEYFIYGNVLGSDWSSPAATLGRQGDSQIYSYAGLPYKAGEEFKVVKNEKEAWIGVSAGEYTGTLNTLVGTDNFSFEKDGYLDIQYDAEAGKVTVSDAAIQGWGVIGNINDTSWSSDVAMTQDGHIWTSPSINFQGEFKIRLAGNWAAGDYGAAEEGVTATLNTPIALAAGGKNITYNGTAVLVFDEEALTITLK